MLNKSPTLMFDHDEVLDHFRNHFPDIIPDTYVSLVHDCPTTMNGESRVMYMIQLDDDFDDIQEVVNILVEYTEVIEFSSRTEYNVPLDMVLRLLDFIGEIDNPDHEDVIWVYYSW